MSDSLPVPIAGHDLLRSHHGGHRVHPRQPEDHPKCLTYWQVRLTLPALWPCEVSPEQYWALLAPFSHLNVGEMEPTSPGCFMGPVSQYM